MISYYIIFKFEYNYEFLVLININFWMYKMKFNIMKKIHVKMLVKNNFEVTFRVMLSKLWKTCTYLLHVQHFFWGFQKSILHSFIYCFRVLGTNLVWFIGRHSSRYESPKYPKMIWDNTDNQFFDIDNLCDTEK